MYGDVLSARLLRASVREVFFTKSRIPLKKYLLLPVGCASTLQRMPLKRQRWTLTQLVTSTGNLFGGLVHFLNVSILLCYVYRWFREVCSTTLLNTTILLGGSGKIVQVDESLFRHIPKVKLNLILIMHF